MTHDELRDYIDRFDAAGMVNEPAVNALRAVVELHRPWELENNVGVRCSLCANYEYPCPTIQAIEEQLK